MMRHRFVSTFRAVAIVVLVGGIVSAAFSYVLRKPIPTALHRRKGFTMRSKNISSPPWDHKPFEKEIASSESVRYQRSDGTFKEVRKYFNNKGVLVKKDLTLGIPGQGVFALRDPKGPLIFLSSFPTNIPVVADPSGHSQRNFVREDVVHGHSVFVLGFHETDGGYVEMYCAPDLNDEVLRTVMESPGGCSVEEVTELVEGDPDNSVFGPLPNLLVSYDLFKWQIANAEEAGNHEVAEGMRQQLNEQIAREMREE